jgi:hypothetical protein
VERSFTTLWGRVRSMLNYSGVPDELRNKLWAACTLAATKLVNLTSKNTWVVHTRSFTKRNQR